MPRPREIVINTGPLIALVAALGDLAILKSLYHKVHVPYEVSMEIMANGAQGFAAPHKSKLNGCRNGCNPRVLCPCCKTRSTPERLLLFSLL